LTGHVQVGNISPCVIYSQGKTGAGEAERPHRLAVRTHRPHHTPTVFL